MRAVAPSAVLLVVVVVCCKEEEEEEEEEEERRGEVEEDGGGRRKKEEAWQRRRSTALPRTRPLRLALVGMVLPCVVVGGWVGWVGGQDARERAREVL